ncbi:MAG: bifunctional nuclease family protein [Vicingaceae bacterium]
MKKIGLDIVGLSYSQTQSGAYALVLAEQEGKRRLPIIIGGFEAQAIAIELEDMTPSRPLTHDLFKSFAESFQIEIKEIIIYNLVEGIFYAKLICIQNSKEVEIDTRTSDAVALAVRFKCPIFTYEFILEKAGIVLEEDVAAESPAPKSSKSKSAKQKKDIDSLSIDELNERLQKAIDTENYEEASRLRDEIQKRSETNN